MLKKLITFIIILTSLTSNSQIMFENGYYITNDNKKIDCLIKNMDWKSNPDNFEYKLSPNEESNKIDIQDVSEFGIIGDSKYIRTTVKIDRSSQNISTMDTEKNPIFTEEKLFLKVLVEGKASLFFYEDSGLRRYFYSVDDSEIKQLVYKLYSTDGMYVSTNNQFRQQLFVELKNSKIEMKELDNLNYSKKDLKRFFINYNNLNNSGSAKFDTKKKDLFNLTLRPGLNNTTLSIENTKTNFYKAVFDSKLNLRLGLEAEFIFPFNKNKWSVIIEPVYETFKSEAVIYSDDVEGGVLNVNTDFKTFELAVGARHYFFLNNTSKIFIDASYVFDIKSSSVIDFKRADKSLHSSIETKAMGHVAFGAGYKYLDKYSVELRHQSYNILSDYPNWESKYKALSVVFGYSFF